MLAHFAVAALLQDSDEELVEKIETLDKALVRISTTKYNRNKAITANLNFKTITAKSELELNETYSQDNSLVTNIMMHVGGIQQTTNAMQWFREKIKMKHGENNSPILILTTLAYHTEPTEFEDLT
ncbi:hypothetical protein ACJJTC_000795 [Scirpophaga incertulas]